MQVYAKLIITKCVFSIYVELADLPALRCVVNCSFHIQWCWFNKYMVCRVCNQGHILKPSSHHAGLENTVYVSQDLTSKLWAQEWVRSDVGA